VIPECDPTTLRFAPEFIAISIWSYARVTNFANVEQNGTLPAAENPAPTEIMFCSAILHSTNRGASSASFANVSANVELLTSASSTTTSGFVSPSARSASPYAFRVASLPAWSTLSMSTNA
jgi:hypothetical protein